MKKRHMTCLFCCVSRGAGVPAAGGGDPQHQKLSGDTEPGAAGLWRAEQPAFISQGETDDPDLLSNLPCFSPA